MLDIAVEDDRISPYKYRNRLTTWKDAITGAYAGRGVQGVQVNPPFFKLIIFIAWLGMHV